MTKKNEEMTQAPGADTISTPAVETDAPGGARPVAAPEDDTPQASPEERPGDVPGEGGPGPEGKRAGEPEPEPTETIEDDDEFEEVAESGEDADEDDEVLDEAEVGDASLLARRYDAHLDPEERAALEAAAEALEEDEEAADEEVEAAEIDRRRLDPDALKVIRRLRKFGHEAYLVGGCVRDLLLGLRPKDFDVATSARPEETKAVFSNCRIIGRRFRLAHVYFRGGKVIETATFRTSPHQGEPDPEAKDLYIEQDNEWGTAEEDARRRDFTINGLFYDPKAGKVIDHVGGLEDLRARTVRTIGDPMVRMAEDPVRILRAVRFATKLGFAIDQATFEAMKAHVKDIERCATPRVVEEVLRLMRGGAARGAFSVLQDLGALPVLVPPVATFLKDADEAAQARFFALLDAMDERNHGREAPLDDAVLLATLLSGLFDPAQWPGPRSEALTAPLSNLVRDARLPRKRVERVRLILGAQRVFAGQRRRRFSVSRFAAQPYAADALELLEIRAAATGEGREALPKWRERIAPVQSGATQENGRRSRRRRGGRRRRRGGSRSKA